MQGNNLSTEIEAIEFNECELIRSAFTNFLNNIRQVQKVKTLKKLNSMYQNFNRTVNGKLFLKHDTDHFTNISEYTLSEVEKQFLNLGLNFHVLNKYNKITKEVELEVLYNKLVCFRRYRIPSYIKLLDFHERIKILELRTRQTNLFL